MKKNDLLSDEIWTFQAFKPGEGAAAVSSEAMRDTRFGDDGDLYPLALDASSEFTVEPTISSTAFGHTAAPSPIIGPPTPSPTTSPG